MQASSNTSGNPAAGHPGMSRSPSVISLTAALGDLTMRAAFSHIPLAQSFLWMADSIMMKPAPGNAATGTTAAASLPKPQVFADAFPTHIVLNAQFSIPGCCWLHHEHDWQLHDFRRKAGLGRSLIPWTSTWLVQGKPAVRICKSASP